VTRKRSFLSGYIEGYYGRLLTFAERAGILRKLRAIGAGHYLYAPKEDLYHRREWRTPYPVAWRKEFRGFVREARKCRVQVVPGLAPGLSYRYRKPEDFEALVRKLRSLTDLGCVEAALLMDDIPVELPEADRGAFRSLGEAHGLMLQKLWPRLQKQGITRLWFCPTVYSDFFAPEGVARSEYLRDLKPFITGGIEVMWTGRAIVAPDYSAAEMRAVEALTGSAPVIWDNLYANDYCPGRIFLGPFAGRSKALLSACGGMLLNPTGLYHTDLFCLDLLGGFLRGEAPVTAWNKALKAWEVPPEFNKIAGLIASPFMRLGPKDLTPAKVTAWRAALKPLIWDWKSPLKLEWYPYLYALDADLRLWQEGREAADEAWVRKKYSAVLAPKLLKGR
jgi:hyaluronoglucosaminidase